MDNNEMILFEEKNVVAFQKLAEFKRAKAEMEKQEEMIKADIEDAMLQYGIKSFKNDVITISYVDESTSETIDLKALKEKEPELYAELLEDYRKVTTKKAYVKFLVK